MAKDSRPDIQVLEDRIERLKEQIAEYSDLRLYSSTKRRLAAARDSLLDCVEALDKLVADTPSHVVSTVLISPVVAEAADQAEDADLFDCPDLNTITTLDNYSPREIVCKYAEKIALCCSESAGILQVNQFCQTLSTWYQKRFIPINRNPNFNFKASRIHEWIDLLIVAAGFSIHQGLFSIFRSNLDEWATGLEQNLADRWVVPHEVMKMKQILPEHCTLEAVLLERLVKFTLYDEEFYPHEKHSVEQIVMHSNRFGFDELKIENILERCPKLLVTSSFDITKYQED